MRKLLKNHGGLSIILLANVILAIAVIYLFETFVRYDGGVLAEDMIQNVESNIETFAGQVDNQLMSMNQIVQNYGTYIQEDQLFLRDAVDYLDHWKSFYVDITLVDMETGRGISILPDEEQTALIENYAGKEWVRPVVENYYEESVPENHIAATDIYYDPASGQRCIAFYNKMKIRSRDYLALFSVSMEQVPETGIHLNGLNVNQALLINRHGEIMAGQLPDAKGSRAGERKDDNFYDFCEELGGKKCRLEAVRAVNQEQNGYMMLSDEQDRTWICSYHDINVTDGWKLIAFSDYDRMANESKTIRSAATIFRFMGVWLFLDVLAYFLYNRKLYKTVRIIEKQNEDLKYANQAKSSFVSGISHEIRTPINAILGMNEMIIRESTEEKIQSYATDIQNAGRVLMGIINDVLDFSKIESGKMEIVENDYRFGYLMHDVCSLTQLKAKDKNLDFEIHVDPGIPSGMKGDEVRIRQIIINLLSNAVKYTDAGTVSLIIGYEKLTENRIKLKCAVKDTGIGIRQEDMKELFVEFSRLDVYKNRSEEGTGLGLPIVVKLLEKMGSKLDADSVYGLGSLFSFELEQEVTDWNPVGDLKQARESGIKGMQIMKNGWRAPKASVLVVDDTPVNLTVAAGLLKHTGMNIDTAGSGEQALLMLSEKKYDIVLLDHRMPKMDGIEVIRRLRRNEGINQQTVVIALTANVVSGAKEMYLKEGFTDFLSKPINGERLEKMVYQYLPAEYIEEAVENEINLSQGLAACGGERNMYLEVLKAFVAQASDIMESLQKYIKQEDYQDYMIQAHGLKSSAKYVGAMSLSQNAEKMEKYCKIGEWDMLKRNHAALIEHYEAVIRQIKLELRQNT